MDEKTPKDKVEEAVARAIDKVTQEVKDHEELSDKADLEGVVGGWSISYTTAEH